MIISSRSKFFSAFEAVDKLISPLSKSKLSSGCRDRFIERNTESNKVIVCCWSMRGDKEIGNEINSFSVFLAQRASFYQNCCYTNNSSFI
jgi:hypothetical protein